MSITKYFSFSNAPHTEQQLLLLRYVSSFTVLSLGWGGRSDTPETCVMRC